jgi:hypothetical protein
VEGRLPGGGSQVPSGHRRKICPAGEAQIGPTTSIEGGKSGSISNAMASGVQVGLHSTVPEFVLPVMTQHVWPSAQSELWSHESWTTGPGARPATAGQAPPTLQRWVIAPVVPSVMAQQKLLPVQVAAPHTTLGGVQAPAPLQAPPDSQRVVFD